MLFPFADWHMRVDLTAPTANGEHGRGAGRL